MNAGSAVPVVVGAHPAHPPHLQPQQQQQQQHYVTGYYAHHQAPHHVYHTPPPHPHHHPQMAGAVPMNHAPPPQYSPQGYVYTPPGGGSPYSPQQAPFSSSSFHQHGGASPTSSGQFHHYMVAQQQQQQPQQQKPRSPPPVYDGGQHIAPKEKEAPSSPESVRIIKQGAVYFHSESGWKKRFCSLQSDHKLVFYVKPKGQVDKVAKLTADSQIKLVDGQLTIVVKPEDAPSQHIMLNAINAPVVLKEWFDAIRSNLPNATYQSQPSKRNSLRPNVDPLPGVADGATNSSASSSPSHPSSSASSASSSGTFPRVRPSSLDNIIEDGITFNSNPSSPTSSSSSIETLPPDYNSLLQQVAELKNQVKMLEQEKLVIERKARADGGAGKFRGRSQSLNVIETTNSSISNSADGVVLATHGTITIDFKRDKVEFFEKLGGGGSGASVYRCGVKGFSFAAKILDTKNQPQEVIEPLMREIFIMTGLRHEHIVQYLGSDFNPETKEVRLYTELYSGTLTEVINARAQANKPFSKQEIVGFLFQIAKGLHYLQSQDPPIVHRDLKSDNIFVCWDAMKNPKTLRIGDFDVSKVISAGKFTFTQNVGTPGYIAPEIMSKPSKEKAGGYGVEADTWSFGMIMFELMTLRRPYFDLEFLRLSETNARGTRPNFPADFHEEEFKDLVKLFRLCTSKKPNRRPVAKKILQHLSTI